MSKILDDVGYTPDNIAMCCMPCNSVKSNIFTEQEMLEIADKYIKPKRQRGEL